MTRMTLLKTACVLAFFIAFTGCFNNENSQSKDQNTNVGNQAVNCLSVDLGMPSEEVLARVAAKKEVVDLDLLKRVHLPANASPCQIRDFVDMIVYLSSNQRSYLETDAQTAMIQTAIRGHEAAYLDLAKDWHSPARYIYYALKANLGDEHKELVFSNFEKHPWLIEVVNANGWQPEVKTELISYIQQRNGKVGYNFVRALVSYNDPELSDLMAKSFVNGGGNRHIAYLALKDVEWFDVITPMKQIWTSGDMTNLEADAFSYPLLKTGYSAPFDYLKQNLTDYSRNTPYQYNIDMVNAITNQNLSAEAMQLWLAENQPHLYFDKDQGYYLPR